MTVPLGAPLGTDLKDRGVKLYYWKVRGRAEPIRLLLAELQIPYQVICQDQGDPSEAERFKQDCRARAGHSTTNIPLLSVGGTVYTQTLAILRHLARSSPGSMLYPSDDAELAYRIDMLIDGAEDFRQPCLSLAFSHGGWSGPGRRDVRWWFENHAAPPHLEDIQRLLGDGPYLCGERFTIADILWYDVLAVIVERIVPGYLERFPSLVEYVRRVAARPGIAAWIASDPKGEVTPYWTEKGGSDAEVWTPPATPSSAAVYTKRIAAATALLGACVAMRRVRLPAPAAVVLAALALAAARAAPARLGSW